MTDLRPTIVAKSDRQNADDLLGGPRTITVTKVLLSGEADQPVSVGFEGDGGKPYYPCKTCRRVMVHIWGPDASLYAGRSMTLYRDPSVKFGGLEVGGIRISHMSHIEKPVTVAVQASKGNKKPITVKPLILERAAPKPQEKAQEAKVAPPESDDVQTSPSGATDDLRAFADTLDFDIEAASEAPKLRARMNEAMGSDEWKALRQADPQLLAAVKAKGAAKIKELEESGS